ncbi:hypothetical protein [Streptomyces viridochromogenes]|uniref:Uncharacterized protein n=1 Tax=Streptomyces viridochromogenes Tue57 TaxID=1160705 RepID=L8PD40_STRVR|nr:hypothetical protein [Streptomyces viridochromogenes]ELS54048.1 hypothetical protein STVIR_5071 [Streptomyces viridochromogenes Tue57]
MPEHASFLQLLGAAVLALAAVLWVIGLSRVLRRARAESSPRRPGSALSALPHQRQAAPELEAVELTPAERDAFAGLIRQLNDGR